MSNVNKGLSNNAITQMLTMSERTYERYNNNEHYYYFFIIIFYYYFLLLFFLNSILACRIYLGITNVSISIVCLRLFNISLQHKYEAGMPAGPAAYYIHFF